MKIISEWYYSEQVGYRIDNLKYSCHSSRYTVNVGLDAKVTRIIDNHIGKRVKLDSKAGKQIQDYVSRIIAPSDTGEQARFDSHGFCYVE